MKMKEIKELDTKKLTEELAKARSKVRELRFGVVNRQVKNIREIRSLRQRIARMMTIMKQRSTETPQTSPSPKKS